MTQLATPPVSPNMRSLDSIVFDTSALTAQGDLTMFGFGKLHLATGLVCTISQNRLISTQISIPWMSSAHFTGEEFRLSAAVS